MRKLLPALCGVVFVFGCMMSDQKLSQVRQDKLKALFASHPEMRPEIRQAISDRAIITGMTLKELEWALWSPQTGFKGEVVHGPDEWLGLNPREYRLINSDASGDQTYTTSWWKNDVSGTMFLYFRNDRLVNWSWANINWFSP